MQHIVFLISALLILASCDNPQTEHTPAQKQIAEYTKTLKECKDPKYKQQQAPKESAPIVNQESKTPPPVVIQKNTEADNILKIQDTDILLGDPKSKVVLVEYFSHTCVHCAYYHKSIFPTIKENYIDNNKIAYVIREFISNQQDLDAAILARCSPNKSNFFKFTDVLLQQQQGWAWNKKYQDVLIKIAKLGGISTEEYEKCLDDDTLKSLLISNSRKIYKFPKFIGTPAFFINGEQFTGAYSVEDLSKSINKALAKD